MVEERLNTISEFEKVKQVISEGKNFLLSGGAGSGKTYSLVQIVRHVIESNPTTKIACITYTNAAVKEIEERVDAKNLAVSTIHDFLWDNIKNFNKELKQSLIKLINDDDVNLSISGTPQVGADFFDNVENIQYKEYLRLREGIISHDEVILLAEYMFSAYPKLCDIVKDRFKYIFVDEYQDTHPNVVKILLEHFSRGQRRCIVGFFGDSMQSIYDDSVGDLEKYVKMNAVIEIVKNHNRRNPQSVIDLANSLRTDSVKQIPSNDLSAPNMIDGKVKIGKVLFIHSSDEDLNRVKNKLTTDYGWDFNDSSITKELNLTHNLIANKVGFGTLYEIFDKDPIVKRISQLKKFIRKRDYPIDPDSTFEEVSTQISSAVKDEIDSYGLRSFTILKYFEYLQTKYAIHRDSIAKLRTDIGSINDNTIPSDKRHFVSRFIKDTQLNEIEFIYEIKLLKDLVKYDCSSHIDLYNSIKDINFHSVEHLFIDKDQLIDDKKQDQTEESKKGSKRDKFINHLFRIEKVLSLYNNGMFHEFIKSTDYYKKVRSIVDKKELKEHVKKLSESADANIEEVVETANNLGICRKGEDINEYIENNRYIYDRIKGVKYTEFRALYAYLEGYTPYSTQHKTKGDEFDNVLVILDNGKWNNYNFQNLFIGGTNQTVMERTKKIFYVCCTRAKEQLAVYYHDPSQEVLNIANEWFGGNVISLD